MAITNAIMQMRRGNEIDFDPDKMHPGEWSVSTDKKIIRMCFYPGVCVRMATYEAFEEDMKQIQSILSEARTIQEAVRRINTEVSSNAQAVAEYTKQAKQYRDEAKMYKEQASAIVGVDIATETIPGLMAGGDNMVDGSGALVLTRKTTDRTLIGSKDGGGVKINQIAGVSQQVSIPTPDVPQEIKSSKVREVWTCRKNLYGLGDVFADVMAYKSVKIPAGTYTFSAIVTSSDTDDNTSLIECTYVDGGGNYIYLNRNVRSSYTITFTKDVKVLYFYPSTNWALSEGDTATFKDIQIEEGSTATEYEPYIEKKITLSTPITLRGIDNIKDVVDIANGKYLQNVYNFKINESTYFAKESTSNDNYLVATFEPPIRNGKTGVSSVLSTHFSQIAENMRGKTTGLYAYLSPSYVSFSISIPTSIANDVSTLKTWLIENDVEFAYAMNVPIETDLPLADQIALHQLETFYGVTHLFTDSEIEPVIEVEYGTSKVGAYAIKGMNTAEANALRIEQLNTLTNELATRLVEESEV